MVLLFFLYFLSLISQNTLASEKHWAEGDMQILKNIYQIEVYGELDRSAEPELQASIFSLLGITEKPEKELSRYKLLYYMVEALQVETLENEECQELLLDFDDTCQYCFKANMAPGRAKKVGLLRGRYTAERLIMALNAPVTQAELAALAVRFIEIKGNRVE